MSMINAPFFSHDELFWKCYFQVGSQTAIVEMLHENIKILGWDVFVEKAGIWGEADFSEQGFVDHINTTRDSTDYLWYTTR